MVEGMKKTFYNVKSMGGGIDKTRGSGEMCMDSRNSMNQNQQNLLGMKEGSEKGSSSCWAME